LRSLFDRREAFAVSFDELAQPDADGTVRDLRSIAGDIAPGIYTLTVTVTNRRTNEQATRSTSIRIRDN
jgi:hypothetical protein